MMDIHLKMLTEPLFDRCIAEIMQNLYAILLGNMSNDLFFFISNNAIKNT